MTAEKVSKVQGACPGTNRWKMEGNCGDVNFDRFNMRLIAVRSHVISLNPRVQFDLCYFVVVSVTDMGISTLSPNEFCT